MKLSIPRLLISTTLVVISFGLFSNSTLNAQEMTMPIAQMHLCGTHDEVVSTLKNDYGEAQDSIGLSNTGAMIEVFASPEGSFTVMLTSPEGITCMISAGDNWNSGIGKASVKPGA